MRRGLAAGILAGVFTMVSGELRADALAVTDFSASRGAVTVSGVSKAAFTASDQKFESGAAGGTIDHVYYGDYAGTMTLPAFLLAYGISGTNFSLSYTNLNEFTTAPVSRLMYYADPTTFEPVLFSGNSSASLLMTLTSLGNIKYSGTFYAVSGSIQVSGSMSSSSNSDSTAIRVSDLTATGKSTGTVSTTSTGDLPVVLNGGASLRVLKNSVAVQLDLGISDSARGVLQFGLGRAAGSLDATGVTASVGSGAVIFNHNEEMTFALPITGNVALYQRGSGSTALSMANAFTGGTWVENGTLLLSDVGEGQSVLGTGSVRVESGGTLGGNGIVLGDASVGGVLSPGNSAGKMIFDGDLILESSAQVRIELASAYSFDQVAVNGGISYGGALSVGFLNGYRPSLGDAFQIFQASSAEAATSFREVVFGDTGYGGTFDAASGVLTITAVPEPSAVALVALATVACLFLRRRVPGRENEI